jgi:hypothetical protein
MGGGAASCADKTKAKMAKAALTEAFGKTSFLRMAGLLPGFLRRQIILK